VCDLKCTEIHSWCCWKDRRRVIVVGCCLVDGQWFHGSNPILSLLFSFLQTGRFSPAIFILCLFQSSSVESRHKVMCVQRDNKIVVCTKRKEFMASKYREDSEDMAKVRGAEGLCSHPICSAPLLVCEFLTTCALLVSTHWSTRAQRRSVLVSDLRRLMVFSSVVWSGDFMSCRTFVIVRAMWLRCTLGGR